MDNDWFVFGLEIPFVLQDSPDSYAQIDNSNHAADPKRNNLQLSEWTGRPPTTTIGFLLVLFGFLGGCVGFTSFFASLLFESDWIRIGGSVVAVVCSIVIFHAGLFYLLK